jgi:hypothetical protein
MAEEAHVSMCTPNPLSFVTTPLESFCLCQGPGNGVDLTPSVGEADTSKADYCSHCDLV